MATKGDQYEGPTGNIWNFAQRGDVKGVKKALAQGVDPNLPNKVGWTPLHAAANGGSVPVLRLLLSHDANVFLCDKDGRTPVHEAARSGQRTFLSELLLAMSSGPGSKGSKSGRERVAQILKVRDNSGFTALERARSPEVAAILSSWTERLEKASCNDDEGEEGEKRERRGSIEHHRRSEKGQEKGHEESSSEEQFSYDGDQRKKKKKERKKGQKSADSRNEQAISHHSFTAGTHGAKGHHRGVPFSAKQKKEQLKAKRARQREREERQFDEEEELRQRREGIHRKKAEKSAVFMTSIEKERRDTLKAESDDVERSLQSLRVTSDTLIERNEALKTVHETGFDNEDIINLMRCDPRILSRKSMSFGMPRRPKWKSTMRRAQVQRQEEHELDRWIDRVVEKANGEELNFFEKKVAVWQQLWRTIERADILVAVVDARFPGLHFPFAVAEWMEELEGKRIVRTNKASDNSQQREGGAEENSEEVEIEPRPVILCINKADLVPRRLLEMWIGFFRNRYPSMKIVLFFSERRQSNDILQSLVVAQHKREKQSENLYLEEHVQKVGGSEAKCTESKGESNSMREDDNKSSDEESEDETTDEDEEDGEDEKRTPFKGVDSLCLGQELAASEGLLNISGCQIGKTNSLNAALLLKQIEDTVEELKRKGVALQKDDAPRRSSITEESVHLSPTRWSSTRESSRSGSRSRRSSYCSGDEEGEDQKAKKELTVTVALIGEPNMGKSSIINAIFGRNVVRSSSTPGKTKHFQTLFLPEARLEALREVYKYTLPDIEASALTGEDHTLAQEALAEAASSLATSIGPKKGKKSYLCFCDSPGVVYPKVGISVPLQVVCGSYPIAQLRTPYPVVHEVAMRCLPSVEEAFGLKRECRTAFEAAEAIAEVRGFMTKGGRPDWTPFTEYTQYYRAANKLLRETLDGRRLRLLFFPPKKENEEDK